MSHREYPDLPRAYIDMDGPLVNFVLAAQEAGIPFSEFKLMPGAYRNLPLTDGALDALEAVEAMGFYPWILTKAPAENPNAASEKLHYVAEHIPDMADRITITPDKGAYGRPGDILVDDHPEWANCKEFGGTIFTFRNWKETIGEIQATFAPKPIIQEASRAIVSSGAVMASGRFDPAFHILQHEVQQAEDRLKESLTDKQAVSMLLEFPEEVLAAVHRRTHTGAAPRPEDRVSHLRKTPHLALALATHLAPEYLHRKREEAASIIHDLRKASALHTKVRRALMPEAAAAPEVAPVARAAGKMGP